MLKRSSSASKRDELPPHNSEAERIVLGCVVSNPEHGAGLVERLRLRDFYDLQHQLIFTAMRQAVRKGRLPDSVIVREELKASTDGERVDLSYFASLPDGTVGMFDAYLEILEEKESRRELLRLAVIAKETACDESKTPSDLLRDFRHIVEQTIAPSPRREWFRFLSPSECRDYTPPDGYVLVGDNHITRGSVAVIAGAPGIGKSRAATALAVAGATGADWFGLPVHARFRTAIIQTENGLSRLSDEYREIAEGGLDEWIRVTDPPPYGMAFGNPEFCQQLGSWLEEWKPGVVIIDPWNSVARDNKQEDYLNAFEQIRSVMPKGEMAPAPMIVAHTRKPQGHERRSGRSLLHELAGSYSMGSVPRSAFFMLPASDDTNDERIVWECGKNNNGRMGARSAWFRRNGLFLPCADFDWESFDGDGATKGLRKSIEAKDVARLLEGRKMAYSRLVSEIMEDFRVSERTAKEAVSRAKAEGLIIPNTDRLYEVVQGASPL